MSYLQLAQVATGNELARGVVEASLVLIESTGESWQRIWDLIINPTQPMWVASMSIAQFIVAISLLTFAVGTLRNLDALASARQVIDEMPLPIILGFFLAGNGTLLSNLVLGLREIFLFFLVTVLRIQIAGISVNEALQKIQNTAIVNNRARVIFADCLDKTGTQLNDCVTDPVKIQQAQDILNGIGSVFNGNAIEAFLSAISPSNISAGATSFIASAVTTVIATPMIAIIQFVLLILQLAFINIVEAALVLTAISAPVFLGFSLFSRAAPLFIYWLITYSGLFFIQLGYVALVGFNASVVSLMELAGQPVGTIMTDVALLTFMAIFAPALAVAIASGGGVLLYLKIQDSSLIAAKTIGSLF